MNGWCSICTSACITFRLTLAFELARTFAHNVGVRLSCVVHRCVVIVLTRAAAADNLNLELPDDFVALTLADLDKLPAATIVRYLKQRSTGDATRLSGCVGRVPALPPSLLPTSPGSAVADSSSPADSRHEQRLFEVITTASVPPLLAVRLLQRTGSGAVAGAYER